MDAAPGAVEGGRMNRNCEISFELYVMDIAEQERCKTAKDYMRIAEELHEAVENAIQDMCMDYGIDDYEPSY